MTESDTLKKEPRKRAVLDALEKSLGVVAQACQTAGISRQTFYRWQKEDADFHEQVKDISEMAVDFVESQLFKQIQSGSTGATIFYLKTKGKARGYVETQEVAIADRSNVPSWWVDSSASNEE